MKITPLTSAETIVLARTLIQSGRGAVLQGLLELIQTLSSKTEEISLHELTDILDKDPIVVTRVLGAANTVHNNPGITPLTSLSHAVHQVGFQKVRSIAVSMMLLESATGDNNCPEQRAAAAHALCAGLIARSCAASLGYADPDLLFACGTLRNLGAVLLPAFAPEYCREVAVLCETMSSDEAHRLVFGLTPLELSREMVSSLRMPKEVIYAMDECCPEIMADVATHLSGRILGITEFGTQLAALALSGKHSSASFVKQSQVLARRFHHTMPDASTLIPAAMEHTNEQLSALTRHGNFISQAVFAQIRSHTKLVCKQTEPEAAASPRELTVHAEQALPLGHSEVTAAVRNEAVFEPPAPRAAEAVNDADWMDQLEEAMTVESQPDAAARDTVVSSAEDPWLGVLSTIQQMVQADQCAVFVGGMGAKRAELHRWTGNFGQGFNATPVCTATERTVFGVCLLRNETVLIHDGLDARLNHYLPAWMGTNANRPGAFMLLALSADQPAGFIYLTWKTPRKITITAAQTSLIRSLIAPHLAESSRALSR